MVLSVSGLRLSLTSAGLGEVAQPFDVYNLLASQNGDLLLTQDEKPIQLNLRGYLTTQEGTFLTTEQDDFLLIN